MLTPVAILDRLEDTRRPVPERRSRMRTNEPATEAHDAVVAELSAKLDAARSRLAVLREARRPHALPAVSGDPKARKAIEKLESEVAAAASETMTLADALQEAEREQREEEARAAAEELRGRRDEATDLWGHVQAASKAADEVMNKLATVLDEREQLITQLWSTGVVYHGAINAMRRPQNIRSALFRAGVGRHLGVEIGHVVGRQRQSLAQCSAVRSELVGWQQADDDEKGGT
jgi:uncharacterized protein YhaN